MAGWEGLLLIDKPSGPTSHDVVDRVRKATGQRRVGHAGTLDPLASGLLPLVLGRATRLVRFLPRSPKCYEGSLRLGLSTTTDDITGEVREKHVGSLPDSERVLVQAASLVGEQLQVPPAVSARKVGGRRLYRLARAGVRVEAAPSRVHVFAFEVESTAEAATYIFRARVSGGTYIRAMVRDLGAALGCGGVLLSLRRTAIGPMAPPPGLRLDPKAPPEAGLLKQHLLPLEAMPLEPPAVRLSSPADAQRFAAGVALPTSSGAAEEGYRRVIDPEGRLLGVAQSSGGLLQPRVVLPPRA